MTAATTGATLAPRRILIRRHSVVTRLTHWVNVLCLSLLLLSGLQIFNAHPALYWGQSGADARPRLHRHRRDERGRQLARGDADRAGQHPDDRRARRVERGWSARRPGVPDLADPPELSRPGDRAALALLLRLAVRRQRPRLPPLRARRRASEARPRADGARAQAAPSPARDRRPRPAALSRGARRRAATTRCRSSPISASSRSCCR